MQRDDGLYASQHAVQDGGMNQDSPEVEDLHVQNQERKAMDGGLNAFREASLSIAKEPNTKAERKDIAQLRGTYKSGFHPPPPPPPPPDIHYPQKFNSQHDKEVDPTKQSPNCIVCKGLAVL